MDEWINASAAFGKFFNQPNENMSNTSLFTMFHQID